MSDTLLPVSATPPDTPAIQAVSRAVRRALDLSRANVAEIGPGADPEFLHDYRVNLRKVRSALALLPGVFSDPEETKRILSRMAKETNRLRDIDVYLSSQAGYEKLLPRDFLPALASLRSSVEAAREEEFARVISSLEAPARAEKMAGIDAYFSAAKTGVNGERPIREAVAKSLKKRIRGLRRFARRIAAGGDDAELHAARIRCKKLRYLLDLFPDLFPGLRGILDEPLSRLQDRLGEFNDVCVQCRSLSEFCREYPAGEAALGAGLIVGFLSGERPRLKKRASAELKAFCRKRNLAAAFRSLQADSSKSPLAEEG